MSSFFRPPPAIPISPAAPLTPEDLLFAHSLTGDVIAFSQTLRHHPKIDVNFTNHLGLTLLMNSCAFGHDVITSLLLAHPGIDVNLKNVFGRTPFWVACFKEKPRCVRALLQDARVEINEPGYEGDTPIFYAASGGYLEIIQWMISSGRDVFVGHPRNPYNDALMAAREVRVWHSPDAQKRKVEVARILEQFQKDPEGTRRRVRRESGYEVWEAAELLARLVFLNMDILRVRAGKGEGEKARRFFRIARKLPLELQVVLCLRFAGAVRQEVPRAELLGSLRILGILVG